MKKRIPEDFFKKVEFDKIIEHLCILCKGEQGKEYFRALDFIDSAEEVNISLALVKDFHRSFEFPERIPVTAYHDIEKDIYLLSKNNYVLESEALFRINASIRQGHDLISFFKKANTLTLLTELALEKRFDPSLVDLINSVLDPEGNVRPDASPELLKISRHIQSKMREIDNEFAQIVKYYKEREMLTDSAQSYRNGRRVLSLPAEQKRQIQGVLHDESSTGKTVFIEPEQMVKLNNELFAFENEYRIEINRIFKKLCADLRAYLPVIADYHDLIIQMDIIGSKARWARLIQGNFPIVDQNPGLHFKEAYHPLLKLKNQEEEKETVPFSLELFGSNRILLVSGPNAGGKSILMKGIALLQTMIQCGIPIPVDSESKIGFFSSFMADIGDQQSIENDLSTYSSRLKIMAEALESVDDKTLLVIDEFGSGTDPKFGGALAESILFAMNKKKCYGIVTTHYSNLKIFAYKTKGIVNGAMIFNQEKLQPTYELKIGKPGSSFAFEIADQSGIPASIMKYARKRTGVKETKVEDLLVSLQREKAEVEAKLTKLMDKEEQLDRLMKNYTNLHKDLEVRRKKLKIRSKETELQNNAKQNKEFENLIRELREEKKIEEAKQKAAELKRKQEVIHREASQIEKDLLAHKKRSNEDFEVGDFVKIGNGIQVGKITRIRKNRAEVLIGEITMEVKLTQLIPAKEPIEKKRNLSVKTLVDNTQTLTSLDLRGMSKMDADRMIEDFLDKAILSSVSQLKIIHGVGGGVLRNLVFTKIKEYRDIKQHYHPEMEYGGDGVTIIEL